MKITKRQLRRIIKEEKARLLRESMTDMTDVQNVIEGAARQCGDAFVTKMYGLWDEAPDAGIDLSAAADTDGNWQILVDNAVLNLESELQRVIEEAIQRYEMAVIDGETGA